MVTITDSDSKQNYARDASNLRGEIKAVYLPENVGEVQTLTRELAQRDEPFSICGNGTGLCGGRVAQTGSAISLERLRRYSVDMGTKRATAEAGLSMNEFQQLVSEAGLLYPPDPTEWSAALGGTWATNASGARTFKYGATRNYAERLKVVLADGEVLDLRRGENPAAGGVFELVSIDQRKYVVPAPQYEMPQTSKHAAGYYSKPGMDAIDLFIGCEGTLGILCEAELRLVPAPEKVLGMIVFFNDEQRLLDAVTELRSSSKSEGALSPRLVEFFDRNALDFIESTYPDIPKQAVGSLWIEQEYNDSREDETFAAWTEFAERNSSLHAETWYAVDARRHAELRAFRHALPSAIYENISQSGHAKVGTDIAVPEQHFNEFYYFYKSIFREHDARTVTFGHIGNCHLHANIFSSESMNYEHSLEIYDECITKGISLGGTVSAEHGIGKLKKKYLTMLYPTEALNQMRSIKRALDPKWLLGAGTMFDQVDR